MLEALKNRSGPRICSWVPRELWHQFLGLQLLLPYYHLVSDDEVEHVSGLYKFRTVRQFQADLEFFLRYYTPVSLGEVICHLDGDHCLPKRSVLLTFDDGFREIYEVVAPLLHAKGVPAVFFLITSAIDNRELCYPQRKSLLLYRLAKLKDSSARAAASQILTQAGVNGTDTATAIRGITYHQRHLLDQLGTVLECDFAAYTASAQPYLTSEQIRTLLKRGFAIGAHSVDHPLYTELDLEHQLQQTTESLRWLSQRFQYDCQSFAFPYRDTGISREFFQKAFADARLKVSFGGEGLRRQSSFPRHLARFSMEKTELPAAHILARQFGRALLRRG
jgi:peptidoglycan/xylan/chitin deacetylase (PgdA/CDA1 family)